MCDLSEKILNKSIINKEEIFMFNIDPFTTVNVSENGEFKTEGKFCPICGNIYIPYLNGATDAYCQDCAQD